MSLSPVYLIPKINGIVINPSLPEYNKVCDLEERVTLQLREWSQGKQAASTSLIAETDREVGRLAKKEYKISLIVLSLKIALLVSAILTLIGVLFLALPLYILSGNVANIYMIGFTGSAITGLVSIAHCALISIGEKLGKRRVILEDENFRAFVTRYSIDRNGFVPLCKDLLDAKLHTIYINWRKEAQAILQF